MKRILGISLAVLLAWPLAASAAEVVAGKVQSIDRASHSFVLENGTRLTLDENSFGDVREGEMVRATFVTQDGQNVVTQLRRESDTRMFDDHRSASGENSIQFE